MAKRRGGYGEERYEDEVFQEKVLPAAASQENPPQRPRQDKRPPAPRLRRAPPHASVGTSARPSDPRATAGCTVGVGQRN